MSSEWTFELFNDKWSSMNLTKLNLEFFSSFKTINIIGYFNKYNVKNGWNNNWHLGDPKKCWKVVKGRL